MIKPYIKNETAVDIICSICDRMYPGMDCEPADCEWMKMLAEESVDAVPVVRCKDCMHYLIVDEFDGGKRYMCKVNQFSYINSDGDMHYCSYGERKEESHDRLQKDL
nr:MAG TPA: hypothetical protein [Caudoviricetes sp.]